MEKIKHFIESDRGRDILTVFVIILVGLASFELGRLSQKASNASIRVEYPKEVSNSMETSKMAVLGENTDSTTKTFFASNRGSKYYSIGCSAGKTIKKENRIYFNSKEEAEGAGYELSSTCR